MKDNLQKQFYTGAYKTAALDVLLAEANRIARDLELPEKLPITRSDLQDAFVNTPYVVESAGYFGYVSTSNYYYYANVGSKLGWVDPNLGPNMARESALYGALEHRFLLPKSQMDTNAAYGMATQWLTRAGMDVQALERDAVSIEINAWELGAKFVPVYVVRWLQLEAFPSDRSPPKPAPIASIQFLAPERRVLKMRVNEAKYVRRRPLVVADQARLLQETEDPKLRELWFTTEAYKAEVLRIMLKEVNWVARALALPEKFPIEAPDLTDSVIGTPYTADHGGRFVTVYTEKYAYHAGRKIASVGRPHRFLHGEQRYFARIRTRYVMPRSRMDPDAAYNLATQWLAAVSVDLKRLEADYQFEISPLWMSEDKFVPFYTVEWVRSVTNSSMRDVAAMVQVLEPERSLEGLVIEKPEYMTRGPIVVPNREKLLEK